MFRGRFAASVPALSQEIPLSSVQGTGAADANVAFRLNNVFGGDSAFGQRTFGAEAKFVCLGGARLCLAIRSEIHDGHLTESTRDHLLEACQSLLQAGADVRLVPEPAKPSAPSVVTREEAMALLTQTTLLLDIFSRPAPDAGGQYTADEACEVLALVVQVQQVLNVSVLAEPDSDLLTQRSWTSVLPRLFRYDARLSRVSS